MKWDSEYLYVAAIVTDGTFQQDTGGGANMYKGDSLEILLDTNLKGDYCDTGMSSDDYQLGISPRVRSVLAQRVAVVSACEKGREGNCSLPQGSSGTGWEIIARVPWNIFGITPVGRRILWVCLLGVRRRPCRAEPAGRYDLHRSQTDLSYPIRYFGGRWKLRLKPDRRESDGSILQKRRTSSPPLFWIGGIAHDA